MAITHPLWTEIIAWVNQLDDMVLIDARKAHGPHKCLPHLIETRGTDHIKRVWQQFISMSGEEIVGQWQATFTNLMKRAKGGHHSLYHAEHYVGI